MDELTADANVIQLAVASFNDWCSLNISQLKPALAATFTAAEQAALATMSANLSAACDDAQDKIAAAITQVEHLLFV